MDGRERTGVHPEELRAGWKALMRCGGPSAPRPPKLQHELYAAQEQSAWPC